MQEGYTVSAVATRSKRDAFELRNDGERVHDETVVPVPTESRSTAALMHRSEDAEELLHRDVLAMDKPGFHLTVVGVRPHGCC